MKTAISEQTAEIETIETIEALALVDPSSTGITALRAADETALRLWSVKGPRGTDSTISAVLLDGPKVALLHQFAGGKFKLFGPVTIEELTGGADV